MKLFQSSICTLVFCLLLTVPLPSPAQAPEAASGRVAKKLAVAHRHMVVAAHPLAAEAGRAILNAGGNALDAAIATQLVLNVVEPQSSGIGGGGFLLYYDTKKKTVTAWDGRETAPAAATPERFLAADGRPLRFMEAVASGLSVGVPGLLAMLEAAHAEHGRMGWQALFSPALRIADDGFVITPRLATLIAADRALRGSEQAREIFYREDGSPKLAGDRLRNLDLGRTLRRISRDGSKAFYEGEIAANIVAAVRGANRPGDLTQADLAAYRPVRREVLCTTYRAQRICGMPPPSSGAATLFMMLGMLERFPMARYKPGSATAVHLMAEAGSLAYADRDRYLADPDFVTVPLKELLDPYYLARRGSQIHPDRSLGRAQPGTFAGAAAFGEDHTAPLPATTHVSVVDGEGNAVSMTTSIESAFGSRIMVHGLLLNNQLTDFSLQPSAGGVPAANRVQPGKRPRSSMSPTLVFDGKGRLQHVLGSPGGNMIINYVAKTLIALTDWKLDPQAAADLPNFGSRNRGVDLEAGTGAEALAPALRARGHEVHVGEETSGVHVISIDYPGGRRRLLGGADPRRDGVAAGD
jgi:gamma-glutamyltranspeptidase/glutathione hydrolase